MFGSLPALIAAVSPAALEALPAFGAAPLVRLRPLDIAVIAICFGMAIWIGFYLKGQSNTGEDFFMAGGEITAWIAGLSFVSAALSPAAARAAKPIWPAQWTQVLPASGLRRKTALHLRQIARIIFYSRKNYRLRLAESSKYHLRTFLSRRQENVSNSGKHGVKAMYRQEKRIPPVLARFDFDSM